MTSSNKFMAGFINRSSLLSRTLTFTSICYLYVERNVNTVFLNSKNAIFCATSSLQYFTPHVRKKKTCVAIRLPLLLVRRRIFLFSISTESVLKKHRDGGKEPICMVCLFRNPLHGHKASLMQYRP